MTIRKSLADMIFSSLRASLVAIGASRSNWSPYLIIGGANHRFQKIGYHPPTSTQAAAGYQLYRTIEPPAIGQISLTSTYFWGMIQETLARVHTAEACVPLHPMASWMWSSSSQSLIIIHEPPIWK